MHSILRRVVPFFLLTTPMTAAPDSPSTFTAKPVAPYIVLKLDDMVAKDGRVPDRWRRIADFAEQRKIKVSIGIIGNSLEGDHPEYIASLKQMIATGRIEFWHHGYDHRQWVEGDVTLSEFSKTNRAHQLDHLARTQQLAKDKLALTFTTFGAPFNAIDSTTANALSSMPEIKVWLYGDAKLSAGKFIGSRESRVNIEAPVHKPNYEALVKGFEAERSKNHRYFVIQGHPMSWDDNAFAEFVRIVDYLAAQGCMFVLPVELPDLLK
ncbi:MAG: polysaccharide deacetylase [Rariglobus sp.]|nr:polysaccharide deacetylase [Rariglobus sp.]